MLSAVEAKVLVAALCSVQTHTEKEREGTADRCHDGSMKVPAAVMSDNVRPITRRLIHFDQAQNPKPSKPFRTLLNMQDGRRRVYPW